MLFTFAPRTPALAAMHAVGRLFPRGDRAPAIEPVAERCAAPPARRRAARCAGWRAAAPQRIASGFYTSQALELVQRMNPSRSLRSTRWPASGRRSARASCRSPMRRRAELPLGRLLRLSLFQVSVGMAMVLLIGTLNRVMIVELGVPAWLVVADGGAAAGVRAVARADRLPLRHPPLGARLAARALHLDGHAAAVRRPGDHAVRADRAVGRHATARPGSARSARRSPSCWSAPACTRRRPPAWRWPPTSRRRRRGRASWRCST